MDNNQIADQFSLLSKLMDIHNENSFKAKSYAIASFNIEKLPMQLSSVPHEKISVIKGIGESTAKKIIEILDTGELQALKEIISQTPSGIIEMLQIKGIGPKKISTIWKEMQIETIGELLYACKENRLKLYKGFGEKTQKNVEESIEFYLQHQGTFLFAQTEIVFPQIKGYLQKIFHPIPICETGAFRKQDLILEEIEFIVNTTNDVVKEKMKTANPPELLIETEDNISFKLMNGLKLKFNTGTSNFSKRLFLTSGSNEFVTSFISNFKEDILELDNSLNDTIFFTNTGIQYIEPYLRETATIIEIAKKHAIPNVIQPTDIKGIIHNHSNWSDGGNTIEEMAKSAIQSGFEYLVISDHSKSAFYAQGLSEEKIKEQHKYIDELNAKFAPFKIFKSIECDILNDGSLDYSNEVLATFDLVIASVHSNLKMSEEKAMQRLLKAIENPYTTILGHPTGRLLLSRKGYPINHTAIIDACAEHNVVIELNANPNRLDIDWSFIQDVCKKKVLISINPDAHSVEGFNDIKYGVYAAQKGMLTKENNLSSFSLQEFELYLKTRKESRMR